MDAAQHFKTVKEYIASQEPTVRLALTVKLYYAYFLTIDELQLCYQEFGDDYRHPDSEVLYRASLDWFHKFSSDGFTDFEDMLNKVRPFIWGIEALTEEFPELIAKLGTPFVTYDQIDYSSGVRIGESPLHNIEWYEERGMIQVNELLISRSIQRVMIGERPSEKIVVAMPLMPQSEFTSKFKLIPGMSGGCAFQAVYGVAQLDINYADSVGIDDVDSVMLCVGKMLEDEKTRDVSIEEFPRFDYFNIKRTLRNGVEVPFIR